MLSCVFAGGFIFCLFSFFRIFVSGVSACRGGSFLFGRWLGGFGNQTDFVPAQVNGLYLDRDWLSELPARVFAGSGYALRVLIHLMPAVSKIFDPDQSFSGHSFKFHEQAKVGYS